MKILIAGCGWLGLPLASHLVNMGHEVIGTTTTEEKLSKISEAGAHPLLLQLHDEEEKEDHAFTFPFQPEVMIVCISPGRQPQQYNGYAGRIAQLCSLAVKNGCSHILFVSSTSVYDNAPGLILEERAQYDPDPKAQEILKAEKVVQITCGLNEATILRFGGLFGPQRHPARFVSRLSEMEGNMPVNLIHLNDCISIIETIILKKFWGEVMHACAPEHPLKSEFYSAACENLGTNPPLFLHNNVPHKTIHPHKLLNDLGYVFRFANPIEALAYC